MTIPDSWQTIHEGRLAAMIDVAMAAGKHTLKYFRSDSLVVDAKKDDSPVTVADREAEQLTRDLLAELFPNDTVQGEEFEEQTGSSSYRWVVDPIDGTKSFICGVPLYSTLLALECDGEPLAGVIFIPAMVKSLSAPSATVVGIGTAKKVNGPRRLCLQLPTFQPPFLSPAKSTRLRFAAMAMRTCDWKRSVGSRVVGATDMAICLLPPGEQI